MNVPVERRTALRLGGAFQASLRTRGEAELHTVEAVAEEVSAAAIRLRVNGAPVSTGDQVFVVVHLAVVNPDRAPRVAVRGRVSRVERRPDGSAALVIDVRQRRWLYAPGRGL